MENQLKYFLPAYLVAYFFAAFFWRSFVVWKRTGVNPLVFKGSDSAHDYIGRVFKLLFAAAVPAVVVYSTSGRFYEYLIPMTWLEHRWFQAAGIVLLLTSLAWTIVAQAQMGESWRIGINEQHRTPLVREGVFGLSREPHLPRDDAHAAGTVHGHTERRHAARLGPRRRAHPDPGAA